MFMKLLYSQIRIKLDMHLTLKALIAYQIMLVLRKLNNCSRTGQISDE